MVEVTEDLVQEAAERIARRVDPEMIILFGSRGRGEASERSDLDLLVVEREGFGAERSRRAETGRIHEALWGIRVPVDVLLFSREEVERWRNSRNHVIARALREGKVLYARS